MGGPPGRFPHPEADAADYADAKRRKRPISANRSAGMLRGGVQESGRWSTHKRSLRQNAPAAHTDRGDTDPEPFTQDDPKEPAVQV